MDASRKVLFVGLPLLVGWGVPQFWDQAHTADHKRCSKELTGLKLVQVM